MPLLQLLARLLWPNLFVSESTVCICFNDLPTADLDTDLPLASKFQLHDCQKLWQAVKYVQDLPYGTNT